MTDAPKLPYIKRLELEKEKLTTALMLVLEYHRANDFINQTGRKSDAIKAANEIHQKMKVAIKDALQTTGGNNV